MTIIIDRIENDTAFVELENLDIVKVPVCLFENAKEGAAYLVEQTGNPTKDNIKKLMNEVFND